MYKYLLMIILIGGFSGVVSANYDDPYDNRPWQQDDINANQYHNW